MKTFIISLGGSIVAPAIDKIDVAFLKKFRALILCYVKKGYRFVLIVGGGKPCRMWQDAARALITTPAPPLIFPPKADPPWEERGGNKKNLPLRVRGSERGLRDNLDWIGIRATQLNAELVRAIFGKFAYPQVVWDPKQKVKDFKILLGAGYLPGHSSDYDAVVRAQTLGADTVVNLSNVAYVYDKNPQLFPDAKPLKNISWAGFFKLFGKKWVPGGNVPFDQIAAKTAADTGMKVVFIGGENLKNFENFLQGKKFSGTIIG